jgi:hypothetical protein
MHTHARKRTLPEEARVLERQDDQVAQLCLDLTEPAHVLHLHARVAGTHKVC